MEAISAGWLQVDHTITGLRLPFKLDAGEAAAIALALALKADILLMDEKRGRVAARQCGLTVAGVLGVLLHARVAGKLLRFAHGVRPTSCGGRFLH